MPCRNRRDRFGRLLATCARRERQRTLQELLLRAGWGGVYVFDRRPFTKVSRFRAAASRRARLAGACGGPVAATSAPAN